MKLGPIHVRKLDSLGMAGSPSASDKFYHLLSQHQQGRYLRIFLSPFKHGFVQKDGMGGRAGESEEKTHNRLLEQGLGRRSSLDI